MVFLQSCGLKMTSHMHTQTDVYCLVYLQSLQIAETNKTSSLFDDFLLPSTLLHNSATITEDGMQNATGVGCKVEISGISIMIRVNKS